MMSLFAMNLIIVMVLIIGVLTSLGDGVTNTNSKWCRLLSFAASLSLLWAVISFIQRWMNQE